MDNQEDEREFKVLEDLRGFIFTWDDVKKLNPGEHERFWEACNAGMIKVKAGRVVSITSDFVRKERIVGKKKLIAMGLSLTETYYHFNPRWIDPKKLAFEQLMAEKASFRYQEIRVYADSIDRAVEEALRSKERRERKKIDYELDDDRGWTKVLPEEHRKARRVRHPLDRKPTRVDKAEWDTEEVEEK